MSAKHDALVLKHEPRERVYYFYIIYLSTMSVLRKKIFKIGRTWNVLKRFGGYPKGSVLLYLCRVKDAYHVESEMIKLFKTHFMHEIKYGNEFFGGNINLMIACAEKMIDQMDQKMDNDSDDNFASVRECYKKHLKFNLIDDDDEIDGETKEIIYDDVNEDDCIGDKQEKEDHQGGTNNTNTDDGEVDEVNELIDEVKNKTNKSKKYERILNGTQFICKKCKKDFATKENLNYHTTKNVCKNKNIKCDVCPSSFTTKRSLYRHKRIACKVRNADSLLNNACEKITKLKNENAELARELIECNKINERQEDVFALNLLKAKHENAKLKNKVIQNKCKTVKIVRKKNNKTLISNEES
jgi:hypothetical protein